VGRDIQISALVSLFTQRLDTYKDN